MAKEDDDKNQNAGCGCGDDGDDDVVVDVEVDVIVPVYNAAGTLRAAVESALSQQRAAPFSYHAGEEERKQQVPTTTATTTRIAVYVCCYDDGSTDGSWKILQEMLAEHREKSAAQRRRRRSRRDNNGDGGLVVVESHLLAAKSSDGVSRGAGYARNRAVAMRRRRGGNKRNDDDKNNNNNNSEADEASKEPTATRSNSFLCLLDSDDVMHPQRVATQVQYMMSLPEDERERTLIGCNFDRDPPGSTWHYTDWANGLSRERLSLERFREVTLIQPTWMMCRSRFEALGGYIEAPHPEQGRTFDLSEFIRDDAKNYPDVFRLIHPSFETVDTLRVAEDLRFFHAHLQAGGLLRRCPSRVPFVTYRHRAGQSQSAGTPRDLLLQLRARAFEACIMDRCWKDRPIAVWGAGRDGKGFVKALSPGARKRVYCMADVDDKKIASGYYVNKDLGVKIPIVHFSALARDPEVRERLERAWEEGTDGAEHFGRIHKGRNIEVECKKTHGRVSDRKPPEKKRRKLCISKDLDRGLHATLPILVCVAMYRTNGALESNVNMTGRKEGEDLWHFC